MSQPFNQREECPALGELDQDSGEFWLSNPWQADDNNLSGFERNYILYNVEGRRLLDISHLSGADIDSDSRGVAVGDVTGDGMPDLLVRSSGGGPLKIFRNQFPRQNAATISLRGSKSNRLGIGARLKFELGGQVFWRDLSPTSSFLSQLPSQVHLGLGKAKVIDRLTIYWPSGTEQVLEDLPVNRHLRITEESPMWEEVFRYSSENHD